MVNLIVNLLPYLTVISWICLLVWLVELFFFRIKITRRKIIEEDKQESKE
jgi:hypothetical protein